jgi:hypothetical protein
MIAVLKGNNVQKHPTTNTKSIIISNPTRRHSIRRMVGGFHHDSPKPTKLTTSNSAAHLYADLDESSSLLMDSVMEQLRERLEHVIKVM